MLPVVAVILPLYVITQEIGLLDHVWALVILYTAMNLPIAVWMLRSFMLEVPGEVLEAAEVDGADLSQSFRNVLLPMITPGIAATGLICVIFAWNEVFFAVNLTAARAGTVPVFLVSFITSEGLFFAQLSAAATMGPVPRPDADEVLVAVTAVGVCGSDVHYYEHGRIGGFVVREPLVLGHEAGGVVVAVGDGISKSRVGERVALEPGVPCRRCTPCRQGRYNLCPEIRSFGTPPVDGAFCDYVVLPADFAYAVPDVVSDDAAALLEPLSVGVWANLKAGTTTGTSLLVSGAGPIGLLVAAVASSMGAADVLVSDVDPNRLEMAERYGATQVVDAADPTALDGVEVGAYVDCSGVPLRH